MFEIRLFRLNEALVKKEGNFIKIKIIVAYNSNLNKIIYLFNLHNFSPPIRNWNQCCALSGQ